MQVGESVILDGTEASSYPDEDSLAVLVSIAGGNRGQVRVTGRGEVNIQDTGEGEDAKLFIIVINERFYVTLGDPMIRYFRRPGLKS